MQGKLIVFSAPSGAGKTTIVHYLLSKIPQLEFSISACSRTMRKGEKEGVDYYFLTVEEFRKKIEKEEFIEWEEVYPNQFYGTLKSEINRIWAKNKCVIFDVDVEGGLNLKKKFKEKALAVFVMPPSVKHLEERLKLRATETTESLRKRINKAEKEIKTANRFDKILLNDDLSTTCKEAEKIVLAFL